MLHSMRSLWLHFNSIERPAKQVEENEMRISVSELPVLRGGPGKVAVSIQGNGQISLTKEASKVMEGMKHLAFTNFDAKTRSFEIMGLPKVPVKVGNDVFKQEDVKDIVISKKTGQIYFAGSGLCKHSAIGYDYKASGRQMFDAVADPKRHTVTFTFPQGALAAKPVTPRKKKGAVAAAATTAAAAKPEAAEEEIELLS